MLVFGEFGFELRKAVEEDDINGIKEYLSKGANPDARYTGSHYEDSKFSETPLMFAKSAEAVKLLLRAGANINAGGTILIGGSLPFESSLRGPNALYHSILRGNLEVSSALLNAGIDIHHKDTEKRTAMYAAVYVGDTSMIDMLRREGAEELSFEDKIKYGNLDFIKKEMDKEEVIYLEDVVKAVSERSSVMIIELGGDKYFSQHQKLIDNKVRERLREDSAIFEVLCSKAQIRNENDITHCLSCALKFNQEFAEDLAGKGLAFDKETILNESLGNRKAKGLAKKLLDEIGVKNISLKNVEDALIRNDADVAEKLFEKGLKITPELEEKIFSSQYVSAKNLEVFANHYEKGDREYLESVLSDKSVTNLQKMEILLNAGEKITPKIEKMLLDGEIKNPEVCKFLEEKLLEQSATNKHAKLLLDVREKMQKLEQRQKDLHNQEQQLSTRERNLSAHDKILQMKEDRQFADILAVRPIEGMSSEEKEKLFNHSKEAFEQSPRLREVALSNMCQVYVDSEGENKKAYLKDLYEIRKVGNTNAEKREMARTFERVINRDDKLKADENLQALAKIDIGIVNPTKAVKKQIEYV